MAVDQKMSKYLRMRGPAVDHHLRAEGASAEQTYLVADRGQGGVLVYTVEFGKTREATPRECAYALLAEREALRQALRQWKMYAECTEERDLGSEASPEAEMYRAAQALTETQNGL